MAGEFHERGLEDEEQRQKVRYYNPPNILRQKCGIGGFDPVRIQKAEKLIDNQKVDFHPIAQDILARLKVAIKGAEKMKKPEKKAINEISGPVMDLKANGTMFGYDLVSEIAGVLLNFLENIKELNDDGFDVVNIHHRTLETIITNKLKGDGGPEGRALAQELYLACQRYKKKHRIVLNL